METEIIVAVVQAVGAVLAAGIAAVVAHVVGKRISKQEDLKRQLKDALQDIGFLLEVEREYGEEMKLVADSTMKNTIRERVRLHSGLVWSGKNTPGRLIARANTID
jgi:hypothetical protein